MQFVVIGSAAYSLYTNDQIAKDLDIVVYSYGMLGDELDYEEEKSLIRDEKGRPINITLKGVNIDFLKPGQEYFRDYNSDPIFEIPHIYDKTYNMQGVDIVSLPDLMNSIKSKNRTYRFENLIKTMKLPINFVKNLKDNIKLDFVIAYENVHNVTFNDEETKKLMKI